MMPEEGKASLKASSAARFPLKYPSRTKSGKLFSTVDTNTNLGTPVTDKELTLNRYSSMQIYIVFSLPALSDSLIAVILASPLMRFMKSLEPKAPTQETTPTMPSCCK